MRIAVVHDYFTQLGGAEKVAEEIMRMMPQATLHSTVALADCMPTSLAHVPIKTSWMQHLPRLKDYYRLYFLLYPLAVRSLNLSQYDLVISSSSGYVKGVRTSRDALHICYCHTPMRWVWGFDRYSEREAFSAAHRLMLRGMIRGLRDWDIGASRQPDHFIANSRAVAARIARAYGRHAEVIHPPIDISRFGISNEQGDYYLVLSRLISYKRIDLAIAACNLLGRKLLIIGDGPDRARLSALAGPTVTFLGRLPDREVQYHAARCLALIFPGEEDFGMAPLEIAAAGRPTIAFRAGGAMETIVEDETGVFFDRQEPEYVASAIEHFERLRWSERLLRNHARGFSVEVFQTRMHAFLSRIGAHLDESTPFALGFGEKTA
ncbi:glycosyltransferase [Alloacidobacterium dinghuense]|uniref:Glycosyltransferase n=1 Tax=Alloacidobacterium dinghuense TaxID=2763107 RepID=A0A7G8BI70_9BACT|nr:glycosyltransferase [Alloacidobacterium dinghuense]QNI32240.1 glycosyltransferase [Alloacidobacterium dinghuense]